MLGVPSSALHPNDDWMVNKLELHYTVHHQEDQLQLDFALHLSLDHGRDTCGMQHPV